jgi:hypothetical protein
MGRAGLRPWAATSVTLVYEDVNVANRTTSAGTLPQ